MKKVIWQPFSIYQPGYDFGIKLDIEFAREMLETKVSSEVSRRMHELAKNMLKEKRHDSPTPLDFFEDTGFVQGFYLGRDGIWLSAGRPDPDKYIEQLKCAGKSFVEYHSHNVDSSKDAYLLMSLVDLYTEYSDELKRKINN